MRRRKGKEPTIKVVYARPFNPNLSLSISEPNEGVTLVDLPTTQLIFRGKGKLVLVFDNDIEESPSSPIQEPENCLVRVFSISPPK